MSETVTQEQTAQDTSRNAGIETPQSQEKQSQSTPNWPPKGFEENSVVTRYKSPDDAAKALVEKENFIQQSVRIPGQDAKPEELEKFYSKMRPEKPEDYQVDLKIPDEKGEMKTFEPNEQQQKIIEQYRNLAHKYGISNRQFNGFLQDQLNAEVTQARENEMFEKKLLEQQWGSDYHRNVALSNQAFKGLSENAQSALSKLSLKDRYEILHSFGVQSLEDQSPMDGKSVEANKAGLESLQRQLKEKQDEMRRAPTHQRTAIYRELIEIKEKLSNIERK